mgnify:CR=1 FL=1
MSETERKELERLRKENRALRAGARPTDPSLTFNHKSITLGGQGCIGIYGLWKPNRQNTHSIQLYPNQLRRLRRDIDKAMQYVIDNADEMGWDNKQIEQRSMFESFYKYLVDEKLFRIH